MAAISMRVLGEATVQELREAVRGDVITPADPDYPEARGVWNGVHDALPAVVVRCTRAADVIAAVGFARSNDLPIAVRGGGHSVAGFSTRDDGIVIDLSRMDKVRVDPANRRAIVGGGAVWADVDHETQAYGLATTGGLVSTTGVAGFTLGWAEWSNDPRLPVEATAAPAAAARAIPTRSPSRRSFMSCLRYLLPSQASSRSRERRRSHRLTATAIATFLAGLALAVQAPVAGASSWFPSLTPDVAVVPFANDVSWFTNNAFVTVDPASTPLSAQLFNVEGNPLDVTWGQFSSAAAKSYAWTDTFGGATHTDFAIGMSGLIPNGVYSLFYRTFGPDSNNAFCPDVEPTVALTSAFPQFQKPDADSFVASSSGKALFIGRVPGDLLAAAQLQVAVIYHFDGKTYGPVANQAESFGPVASNGGRCQSSYGVDAMRQLVIVQK